MILNTSVYKALEEADDYDDEDDEDYDG